ncbi:Phosphoglycerate dehydrogenase [Handroanthus impetiginosus]|uniref:Phosphoglycerate dehydrogenase n=1 Tax=Handroanthus impetiginosus TaxID=429701 RepID=A0A2G9H2Y6_9LAMI|nr:Phosphoglycerate dehydrogenase [Handroanthus impetiginosus]
MGILFISVGQVCSVFNILERVDSIVYSICSSMGSMEGVHEVLVKVISSLERHCSCITRASTILHSRVCMGSMGVCSSVWFIQGVHHFMGNVNKVLGHANSSLVTCNTSIQLTNRSSTWSTIARTSLVQRVYKECSTLVVFHIQGAVLAKLIEIRSIFLDQEASLNQFRHIPGQHLVVADAYDLRLRSGGWEVKFGEMSGGGVVFGGRKWQRNKYIGVSLVGKTLAVMGFGLGMHVIAHDPYAPADRAHAIGVDLVSFDQAISTADFISLHMPLTPSTNKIFNDETFAKMKKGVCIINVAKGGVIDEDALVRALDTGVFAQAVLDVFTKEPPSPDSKLVQHENVSVTPHLGASMKEAQEGVAVEIAEAVVGALRGELSATVVNAPMVPPEVLSELAPYVYSGLETWLLRAMITKGIIEPISDAHINLVNADFTAKKKGLRIIQISNVKSKFASALVDSGNISIEGKVKHGIPHLMRVGSYSVDVSLEGNLILCRQIDQPGMIGQVGNILGEHNVNVNFMSVGRTVRRTKAIMAIGVDEEPDKDALKKIGEVPAIDEFVFLDL